jgi:hypothetical protein
VGILLRGFKPDFGRADHGGAPSWDPLRYGVGFCVLSGFPGAQSNVRQEWGVQLATTSWDVRHGFCVVAGCGWNHTKMTYPWWLGT